MKNTNKKFKQQKNIILVDGILNIHSTLNNVIFTYTSLNGKVLYWYSCGSIVNLKKGLRSKYLTILDALVVFSKILLKKNINYIYIKFKGVGLIRKTLLKGLKTTNLKVLKIFNTTPVPHNGCRVKKYKRV